MSDPADRGHDIWAPARVYAELIGLERRYLESREYERAAVVRCLRLVRQVLEANPEDEELVQLLEEVYSRVQEARTRKAKEERTF